MSVIKRRASGWFVPVVVLAGCEPCTPTTTTPPDTTPVTSVTNCTLFPRDIYILNGVKYILLNI